MKTSSIVTLLSGVISGGLAVRSARQGVVESSQDQCAESVAGAVPKKFLGFIVGCECPEGQVVTGVSPECWGKTGTERGFDASRARGLNCACAPEISQVGQGGDGNPLGWNRFRRCDHEDYSPSCGPCEGVGGLTTSDKNEDFVATKCYVLDVDVNPETLKRPQWSANFTVGMSHEILIGIKKDAACFQSFPNSISSGPNCYKPQDVVIHYDMLQKKALRLDVEQAGNAWGLVGNVSSVILHQGPTMWITNTLPLGITQTICTQPKAGFDRDSPDVYPLQFNWVEGLKFVAREMIDVEYGVGPMTLDHWAMGPHHAWTAPESGILVRMWQPWNGLQVFEPGTYQQGHNPSVFSELSSDLSTAPLAAKEGGSTFRINCNADGFYEPKPDSEANWAVATGEPLGAGQMLNTDLKRARTKVPRAEYRGSDFEDMSETLNGWLLKHAPNSRECDSFAVEELQQLQAQLLSLRDPQLDDVYQTTTDNRRLRKDVQSMLAEWKELNTVAATDAELSKIHRDGHCHEAVMWYVHHVPETLKQVLRESIALPLLSHMRHDMAVFSAEVDSVKTQSANRVMRSYEDKVTCQSCHANALPS